jgi:diacylglycerol kinase family enzyme
VVSETLAAPPAPAALRRRVLAPQASAHLHLLVNPRASGLRAGDHHAVTALLRERFAVTVSHTEAPGHATELAREAAEAGSDLVAVLGGDGTVSQAAGGLVGSPTPMTCLPSGCTNVFARSIGTPRTPSAAARRLVATAAAGPLAPRAVDVGTVNDRHFLYTSGVGFTASMAAAADHAPERKARLGQLHFIGAAAAEMAGRYLRHPPRMRVQADGRRFEAVTMIVQNARALTYFGPRQMRLCERAGLDTAALSLTLLRRARPLDVAAIVGRLLAGRPGAVSAHAQVEGLAGLREATVTPADGHALPLDADGEYLGEHDRIVYGVKPAALRVIA